MIACIVVSLIASVALALCGDSAKETLEFRLLVGGLAQVMLFLLACHVVSGMISLQMKEVELEIMRAETELSKAKRQEELDRSEEELARRREHELEILKIMSQQKITVVYE